MKVMLLEQKAEDNCKSKMADFLQSQKKLGRGSEGWWGKMYFPKTITTESSIQPHQNKA